MPEAGKADIIRDSRDDDGNLGETVGILSRCHVPREARDGHGRAVVLGHVQALQDNLVKLAVRAACEEPVELDEQAQVEVLRLGV